MERIMEGRFKYCEGKYVKEIMERTSVLKKKIRI